MANFIKAKNKTFKHEGGHSTRRGDTGNWTGGKVDVGFLIGTKYGVSAPMLQIYLNRKLGAQDFYTMQNLSKETAEHIYKVFFWDKIQGDLILDQNVAEIIFDWYFWRPAPSLVWLRRIIGTKGNILALSKKEVEIINQLDPKKLFYALKAARLDYVAVNSKNKGDTTRTKSFEYTLSRTEQSDQTANTGKIFPIGAIAAILIVGFFISKS